MVQESENSKRVLLQATYTPIKSTEQKSGKPLALKRPFDKMNLVASVKPTDAEIAYVRSNHNIEDDNDLSHKDFVKTIKAIESVLPELESPNILHNVARFSEVNADALEDIFNDVITFRKAQVDSITKSLDSILDSYTQDVVGCEKQHPPEQGIIGGSEEVKRGMSLPQSHHTLTPTALIHMKQKQEIKLETLIDWAIKNNMGNGVVLQILELADTMSLPMDGMTVKSFSANVSSSVTDTRSTLEAFHMRMKIEPIGYLHLERLSFTPVVIERGELIYSVPLSPGEEVNITHKEWSNTSEEFQRIVTDFMENFSEEGVSEKTDLAQSSNSQQQHTDGYNLSVTASGGYGPVNITASAGYNAANSSSNSAQLSRNHSLNITRKASSRVTKEHKTSFKVASASGTEDQAIRKIKNLFPDKATRVDYYQLLRKWRVDLTRYGLRLTYDIAIPEPGLDILSKIAEINRISMELEEKFVFLSDGKPINFNDLTPDNYKEKAAAYGVIPERPPAGSISGELPPHHIVRTNKDFSAIEQTRQAHWIEVPEIDDRYVIQGTLFYQHAAKYADERDWNFNIKGPFGIPDFSDTAPDPGPLRLDSFNNMSGKIGPLVVFAYHLSTFYVLFDFTLKVKDSAIQEWQLKIWNAMRDAARTEYESRRQFLEMKLSKLKEELGTGDPLSLRKIEREEVMKGVIRWMFGPTFRFAPTDIPQSLYYENAVRFDKDIWKNVILHGDVIKFLHHAIEWENMLYFLYPYFWSHNSRWEEKKYLEHPDIMHKIFLKSGSARVVLTIRPGFEQSFVSFIESGSLLPNQTTPYISIAQEMENYANTNYPGIPTANPTSDARPLLTYKQQKTWEDMQIIIKLLDVYFNASVVKTGKYSYPLKLSELTPYIKEIKPPVKEVPMQDRWDKDFHYQYPGIHGEYDLASYGADGKPDGGTGLKPDGTPNENADITSWAEASLIGTWYEYTPTSALDITFNEKLPGA